MPTDFRKLAKQAAQVADDKKAVSPVILDIRKASDVADYMMIAGAESSTQLRAIYEGIVDVLRDSGCRPLHHDGRPQDRWMAIDYGGLVVHIQLTEAREFYRLESMWENPKCVDWKPAEEKKSARKRSKR